MEYATVISCAVSIKETRELYLAEIQAYKTYEENKIKVWYKVRTERDVETVISYHESPNEFVFPLETLGFMSSQIVKTQGVKRQADTPVEVQAKKVAQQTSKVI